MNNTLVLIEGPLFDDSEISKINKEASVKNVEFINMVGLEIFDSAIIVVVIRLVQNLAFDAAYDSLKFILMNIFDKLSQKDKRAISTLEIRNDDKKYSIYFNFELTEEHKNKLVDVAIKKLLP